MTEEPDPMGDYIFPHRPTKRKLKIHRWIYAGFILGLMYLLFAHDVQAHEFYSIECCNEQDCAPLPDGAVKITKTGYLWDGELFVYGERRIKYSPDGKYHGCAYRYSGNKLCLYVPPQGF